MDLIFLPENRQRGDNMGQRLMMMIYENRNETEPFAAVYLHWGAYSFSSLGEAAFLLRRLTGKTCRTKEEWQKEIVNVYLQRRYEPFYFDVLPDRKRRHGGIYVEDIALARRMWPDLDLDTENADGNLGLVAISQDGIAALKEWSVGGVRIYLDSMTVDWDVFIQNPVSAWKHGKDGNWRLSYDEDYCIPDKVWENLSEIQTADLTLSDIAEIFEKDERKVSEDGFALAESEHTVIEIIQ